MTPELHNALRVARMLRDLGQSIDEALTNPAIPAGLRDEVREILRREETIILTPARMLTADRSRRDWLNEEDRSDWYYWPRLREFLLDVKGWSEPRVRSLDNTTDRILGQLEQPTLDRFDIRGLVLGFVQSGKTANFSALIAKAADAGFRLIIVLAGVHNSLRKQTQSRLTKELIGYADGRPGSVPLPPQGQRWFTFTTEDLNGDFNPGAANYGALQGTQPVLMVVKKNGPVLRRLLAWLDSAPVDVHETLPVLVIDDEADQASVNIRGNRPLNDNEEPDDDDPDADADGEPPSIINELIRSLLMRFDRRAYVAYTATPFANILIPHDAEDRLAGLDLYPRDFIVDLPKPDGYFGAEEIFGRFDPNIGENVGGLDIIREVSGEDLTILNAGTELPESLETAILDFVLAGAARRQRGDGNEPATMLIHTSLRTAVQQRLTGQVQTRLSELRDEWRYQRTHGIQDRFEGRWNSEFRPLTRSLHNEKDITFRRLVEHIGPFFEQIHVMQINSDSDDVLDYERDPDLKVIVVGGNRLSRGLTLEGLLISYYVRRSTAYDTLMQMGRWFGFREGYEDLTRIYTTNQLEGWFADLADVESRLREDIQIYENEGLTPLQLGARILRHPALLVTSRLKSRSAREIVIDQSYANQLLQTTTFPFDNPFTAIFEENIERTREFIYSLGVPTVMGNGQPRWEDVSTAQILGFLNYYQIDPEARTIAPNLIRAFIERQEEQEELTNWTVAVMGLRTLDRTLGSIDLGVYGDVPVNSIKRTRLKNRPNSLGVITSPGDEEIGMTSDQLDEVRRIQETEGLGRGPAARKVRPATDGLLLIYPISRFSGHGSANERNRIPIYQDPTHGVDVIGIALSFPRSSTAAVVRGTYVVGTVGWRPA